MNRKKRKELRMQRKKENIEMLRWALTEQTRRAAYLAEHLKTAGEDCEKAQAALSVKLGEKPEYVRHLESQNATVKRLYESRSAEIKKQDQQLTQYERLFGALITRMGSNIAVTWQEVHDAPRYAVKMEQAAAATDPAFRFARVE